MHDLVQSVADLVGKPGASRRVHLQLPVPADFELEVGAVREPIELEGVIESVVDGILVRGGVGAVAELTCSRCLEPVEHQVDTGAAELFREPSRVDPDDELEDGYEVADEAIDLSALLRDALSAAIPPNPRCKPDCAGLCAHCGTNLNESTCEWVDERPDPRWDALRDLSL